MKRGLRSIAWVILGPTLLHAADLSPQDFAFGLPIVTTKETSAYRLAVPADVYKNTFREDLGDIRIFNAQSDVVPYSLRGKMQAAVRSDAVQLPLFPLPGGSHVVIDGVRVTIDPLGSAVNWQTQPSATANTSVVQYILDGRTLDSAIAGLRLNWPETDSEYSGHVRVDASDDLGSWRTIVAGAPIANLRANAQAIIENRVSLPPTKAKFWRLSWLGSSPMFKLESVSAETADSPAEPARAAIDIVGTRDSAGTHDYLFDLGAHAPVDRVNLMLPEANTVLKVELSSRRKLAEPWHLVTASGFFRLRIADGDHQNSALEISVDRDRYWRAQVTSGGTLSQGPLRLHVEWVPDEVTFLARGPGPFLLAYGNSGATDAEVDLAQLPANVEIVQASVKPPKILGGPSRLMARAAPFPTMRFALWGTLLLAVLGLAWMAYGLTKEKTERPIGSGRT
jgi:hypothetical protein